MKKIFILLIILAFAQRSNAQELLRPKTAISLELGVHVLPIFWGIGHPRICLDQEVVFWPRRGVSMGVRLGVGRIMGPDYFWVWENDETTTLLAAAYMLTGRKNHHFEAALGPEFWIDENEYGPPLVPFAQVGYRFQKPAGGFLFRTHIGITSGVGVGIGYSFPVRK